MKRKIWPIVVLVALVAMALPMTASANHNWSVYHWARTSNPFNIYLGDNTSGSWGGHLATASGDWSASSVLDTTVIAGGTSVRRCKPTDGMVEVCNTTYGFNGWLGIAGIYISGSHITKGYVKLNDSYFNSARYNTAEWRLFVTCQEVGHTFGLGHQDENFNNGNLGTCMDYTSSPGSNQHPNAHDFDQLESIYLHLDNFDSMLLAPPPVDEGGGGPGNGNGNGRGKKGGASEWGRAIGTDPKGRPDTFEQDLPNGDKIITHVTWAD